MKSGKFQLLDKKAAQCWRPWARAVAQKLSVDWAWSASTGGTFATLYQTIDTFATLYQIIATFATFPTLY